jgi:hypothetical protein
VRRLRLISRFVNFDLFFPPQNSTGKRLNRIKEFVNESLLAWCALPGPRARIERKKSISLKSIKYTFLVPNLNLIVHFLKYWE